MAGAQPLDLVVTFLLFLLLELVLHVAQREIEAEPDADGPAQVVAAAFHGAATRLTLRLADGTAVKADVPSHDAARLPAGAKASVTLPQRPVLVDDGSAG